MPSQLAPTSTPISKRTSSSQVVRVSRARKRARRRRRTPQACSSTRTHQHYRHYRQPPSYRSGCTPKLPNNRTNVTHTQTRTRTRTRTPSRYLSRSSLLQFQPLLHTHTHTRAHWCSCSKEFGTMDGDDDGFPLTKIKTLIWTQDWQRAGPELLLYNCYHRVFFFFCAFLNSHKAASLFNIIIAQRFRHISANG
jgi:hypothetical protein